MIVYPAIDLKDGACVRLWQGDMNRATVYGTEPARQARAFADAGFGWLHVVDLDGAVAGAARNAEAVRSVLNAVSIPVQLGGGIRSMTAIEGWLAAGVRRIVLGTAAIADPELVRDAARCHPGAIVAALDARDGIVAVSGWTESSEVPVADAARRLEDTGIAAIVHTDIGRDGALEGPNLEATLALAAAVEVPVILSGGVAEMSDLERVREAGAALDGVIVGRAFYDGRIDPRAAASLLADDA